MDIALIQFEPALGDPDLNWSRLEGLLEQAAGSELIVLPELANSGYAFADRDAAWVASEGLDGPFLARLQEFALRCGTHLVTGFCERDGNRLFNSAALVGPKGVRGLYRKLHLFDREKLVFEPGNLGLPVFRVGELTLGMLICFDWMFPEAWITLVRRGAELIAHPSNLVLPGRCQKAVPVHAMMQRIYVATANRIGIEADLRFTGESLLADPRGDVLVRAEAEKSEVLRASIDPSLARDKQITARNHGLEDRRGEYYDVQG